jgi:hypothetical protein
MKKSFFLIFCFIFSISFLNGIKNFPVWFVSHAIDTAAREYCDCYGSLPVPAPVPQDFFNALDIQLDASNPRVSYLELLSSISRYVRGYVTAEDISGVNLIVQDIMSLEFSAEDLSRFCVELDKEINKEFPEDMILYKRVLNTIKLVLRKYLETFHSR